jgi:GTP-binding protein
VPADSLQAIKDEAEFLEEEAEGSEESEGNESNKTEKPLKIAVVGKMNSGKSSFVNALANEDRVIVSELPGTTRDSIDVFIEKDGKTLVIIDTAGLKRNKNMRSNVEFYSQNRTQKAIRRSDVVILMLDATCEISKVDKQIADYIREEFKPVIITVNKWDLAKDMAEVEQYQKYIDRYLSAIPYAPLSFTTAKTGKNVAATIGLAQNIYKQTQKRISTGELNRALQQEIIAKKSPPPVLGKQGKIFYATQITTCPPTFVFFVNDSGLFPEKYKNYLFNQFQKKFGFAEVPVKFQFKTKMKNESKLL